MSRGSRATKCISRTAHFLNRSTSPERGAGLPRTFVYCTNPPTGSFDQFAARLRDDPDWKFYELNTGHDCMITDPRNVIRILLENA